MNPAESYILADNNRVRRENFWLRWIIVGLVIGWAILVLLIAYWRFSSPSNLTTAPSKSGGVLNEDSQQATRLPTAPGLSAMQSLEMATPTDASQILNRQESRKRLVASPDYIIRKMRVSAYCPCALCCGKWADGITASGKPVEANLGRFVAAPADIPFGTSVSIPGYHDGLAVPVLDRGSSIKDNRIDCYFPTHQEALSWGVKCLDVVIHN